MGNTAVNTLVKTYSKFIDQPIKTIIEVGARDCQESVQFSDLLPDATVFAFECNPHTINLCKQNIENHPNIKLIEKAVSDKNGKITFYPIDVKRTITTWSDGNPGASSLFKASGKYPVEQYVQKEIEVESITLKKFLDDEEINSIDVLWMDIQGAELIALQGCEQRINDIKLIHLEVEFFEIYSNQPLFNEINSFFKKKGFIFIMFTALGQYAGDAIYLNKSVLRKSEVLRMNIKNCIYLKHVNISHQYGYLKEKILKRTKGR